MKHLKKRFLATLFVMTLVVSSITAYASTIQTPTPRWSYVTMMTAGMDVDDYNAASISVTVNCDAYDTNKVKAKCELQQLDGSWKTIKSWSETNDDHMISYSKEYAVAKKYSYRLKVTAYAYMDSKLLETVTEYFDYGYYQ